jgi:hypothetical protein
MSEATATTAQPPAQAPAAIPTARFALPQGVVTPIELRNHLVAQSIAPATMKPQQMYAWVKSPGKTDPFPVKYYDKDGNVFDAPQTDRLTRPGIPSMDEGVEWYKRRAAAPAQAQATATATAGTPAVLPPADTSDDEITDETAGEAGFDEAE